MQFLRQAALVLQRDITIELRQKSLLVSMIVFSILIQVVLFISFDVQKEAMQTLAAGILWLPIILSAMISFSKYAKAEKENGAMHGMLVSPINRGAMFLGKLMGNLIFVSMVGVVSVPAFFLFLKQPPPSSTALLLLTLFLGSWGFTAIGVFLANLAEASSLKELLVPIMLFPMSVPLLIAIIRLTEMALYPTVELGMSLWIVLLIAYNVLFTVVPLLLFDVLLEV